MSAMRTFTEVIGQRSNAARFLLQIFTFVRYGVEELRDLLVHELNVGSFRRRCGEVALKRWDHDILRAWNVFRVVRGFRRRIVKIVRSIHENCFCFDALECLDGIAIKSRRRTDIVTIIGPGLPNPVVGVKATLQPGILKAIDPLHYVQALRIFGLQAFGSPSCQREQNIDPRAPSFFRLLGVLPSS